MLASAGPGCGKDSSDDPQVRTGAIGKSCATGSPSITVSGGFSPGQTSERTYADCYGAKIVEIDAYDSRYAIGGYTLVNWGEAVPSDSQCTSSWVDAFLFQQTDAGDWVYVTEKSAHGDELLDGQDGDIAPLPSQPAPPVPSGTTPFPHDPGSTGPISSATCKAPYVYFAGTDMPPGHNYKIAATARLGSKTRSITFKSVAGTCGLNAGDQCCSSGEACDSGLTCSKGKCANCGGTGQLCCAGNLHAPCGNYRYCDATNHCTRCNATAEGPSHSECACGRVSQQCCQTPDGTPFCEATSGAKCGADMTCFSCGKLGEECCNGGLCGDSTVCGSDGKCKECGHANEACCSGKTCDSTSTCDGAKCVAKPTCGVLGLPCCAGGVCNEGYTACSSGNTCTACGRAPGMTCCGVNKTICSDNLQCGMNHTCATCGKLNTACCGGSGCSEGTCVNKVCSNASQASCNSSVNITVTACYNLDGSPSTWFMPNVSQMACSTDQAAAEKVAAIVLAGQGFSCLTKTAQPGCCVYTEEVYAGCFCP